MTKKQENKDMYEYLVYFLAFSFLGWCAEVLYCAVKEGKLVNRGLAKGPFCPIYGVGISASFFLLGSIENVCLLFLLSMSVATAVEFTVGLLSDRMIGKRLWDYREYEGNILGYVCPKFSLIWGVICTVVIKILPLISPYVRATKSTFAFSALTVILLLVCSDIIISSIGQIRENNKAKRLI